MALTKVSRGLLGGSDTKNLIINGAMQIAQRGTSFTPSAGDYTLDRWRCGFNNSSPTVTQETGNTFGTQRTHIKLVTGGTSTYAYVAQRIEDIAQFDGKTITVSFDYKSDNDFGCSFEYHFGSGGSSSLYDKHGNTISASATVKRASVTVTLDDISGKSIGEASTSHLDLLFNMTANNKTFEITNVQLEVGNVATPFEHRSYAEELALCQRYFFTVGRDGGNTTNYMFGGIESTIGGAVGGLAFPNTMRAIPSVSAGSGVKIWSATGGGTSTWAIATNRCSKEIGAFTVSGLSGRTVGQVATAYRGSSTNPYIDFDAEL